jgi:hypothetical protein
MTHECCSSERTRALSPLSLSLPPFLSPSLPLPLSLSLSPPLSPPISLEERAAGRRTVSVRGCRTDLVPRGVGCTAMISTVKPGGPLPLLRPAEGVNKRNGLKKSHIIFSQISSITYQSRPAQASTRESITPLARSRSASLAHASLVRAFKVHGRAGDGRAKARLPVPSPIPRPGHGRAGGRHKCDTRRRDARGGGSASGACPKCWQRCW